MKKRSIAGWLGVLLMAGGLGVGPGAAAPDKVASQQIAPRSSAREGVFNRPDTLNVLGIRLGMSRDQIHALNLRPGEWPTTLQFDKQGQVTFVACYGGGLQQGTAVMGTTDDPIGTLHTWGTPRVQEKEGKAVVAGYRTPAGIVLLRYYPATLDSRGGATGEMALARNLASIPWDWDPVRLQNAGL